MTWSTIRLSVGTQRIWSPNNPNTCHTSRRSSATLRSSSKLTDVWHTSCNGVQYVPKAKNKHLHMSSRCPRQSQLPAVCLPYVCSDPSSMTKSTARATTQRPTTRAAELLSEAIVKRVSLYVQRAPIQQLGTAVPPSPPKI